MAGKISVIIPVYNMEDTVGKSIDSVLHQTWKDIELVLVDDGSTDASGKICDKAAAADHRVVVIHKANGGVSSARNAGLMAANGDYIAWLDADDWMETRALETLLRAITENNTSMAICNYQSVDHGGKRVNRYDMADNEIITGREALERLLRRQITQSIWSILAPRSYYERVIFPEGEVFEDVRNSYKMYLQAGTVSVVNDALLYNRLVRSESLSNVKTIFTRVSSCMAYLYRQQEINAFWPESEAIFVRDNFAMLLLALREAVLCDSAAEYRNAQKSIRKIATYFRQHAKYALGEQAGFGKKLEYFLLTSGTRAGFFLSRAVARAGKRGSQLG